MKDAALGFVGLGVMGAPMCRNLALKCGREVVGFDVRTKPPEGVARASSLAELASRAETIFLSLPGEAEIREVVRNIPPDKT
ncbi:MAG TPA: NAD(P)-binding domain-containing protein, partial [Burkholderiales bacterium]|nr:NAD(P)-binding domain-containing protein [Burkholderiales bacterium]